MRHPLRTALAGPPERHLRAWDALTAAGDVLAGLGGQDAHARGVRVRGRVRSIMPHDRWMGLVQTELALDAPLTGDDDADRAAVLAALRAGRTSIVVPPLGDPLDARMRSRTAPAVRGGAGRHRRPRGAARRPATRRAAAPRRRRPPAALVARLAPARVDGFRHRKEERLPMVKVGLYVRLEAAEGRADDLAAFLEQGRELVEQEPGTTVWYALRLGPSTFGIFDAFEDEAGRQAHLDGEVAKALGANADLFASPPSIEQVDVLASK